MNQLKIDVDLFSKRKPGPIEPHDRRKEARYAPITERAYLGWWEEESFHNELGILLNISGGGAALHVNTALGQERPVWLCVLGPNQSIWAAAQVVGHEGHVVRLEFAERFPSDSFKAVVWGYSAEDASSDQGTDDDDANRAAPILNSAVAESLSMARTA